MIRVGCLGAGYFSQFHLEAWRNIAGVALVGVADHDTARARATGAPVHADLDALLDEGELDVLDIIVPPQAHAAAIRAALSRDLRLIICQKPFCTSVAEAQTITAEAEAAGITLIIHENFRFQPWYRAIHEAIGAGDIGRPLQGTFRLRPGDGQGPEAYLARQPYFQTMKRFLVHETAVHWIDTFRYLFGDPTSVYASLRQINPAIAGEDAGVIIFDHPNGVQCVFDGNRHLDHAAENTRCTMGEGLFEGTEGTIELRGDGSVHLRKFGKTEAHRLLPPDTARAFGGDCVRRLQSHVVAHLCEQAPIENTAREYLKVRAIEDAIYTSAGSGKRQDLVLP